MYSVYFRFHLTNPKKLQNSIKSKKWFGFACAPTKRELFYKIDEFIDPYSVEVCIADAAGYCYMAKNITTFPPENWNEDEWEYFEIKRNQYEFSDDEPVDDSIKNGWQKYTESKVFFDIYKNRK